MRYSCIHWLFIILFSCVIAVNAVVQKVGKLASYWNTPLFSMSAMSSRLRDPVNYATFVRVSTPSFRFATALVMFCHHNDVGVLRIFCFLAERYVK